MSIEDRVRAATRARADLVTPPRPLELPESPARARRYRRLLTWGAPLTAAALVIVLAVTLVIVRQVGGSPTGSRPSASASTPTPLLPAANDYGGPQYYVALTRTKSTNSWLGALVGDEHTNTTIAVLSPSAGGDFTGVTAAADDQTFVLLDTSARTGTTFYRLYVTPGAAHPTQLTKLPITPLAAAIGGLALSPDGRQLAVMTQSARTATSAVAQLTVYSMSTGAVLDNWSAIVSDSAIAPAVNGIMTGAANWASLAWVNGDRTLDFRWLVAPAGGLPEKTVIRAIDVTAPGHDLLADSRLVFQLPSGTTTSTAYIQPCASVLITSDGTIVCGASVSTEVTGGDVCDASPVTVATYSPVTGKRLRVFSFAEPYPTPCVSAQSLLIWASTAGGQLDALTLYAEQGKSGPPGGSIDIVAGGVAGMLSPPYDVMLNISDPGSVAF